MVHEDRRRKHTRPLTTKPERVGLEKHTCDQDELMFNPDTELGIEGLGCTTDPEPLSKHREEGRLP